MHVRDGWTQPYFLEVDGAAAGYASILIGGPWKDTRTAFEFYVLPGHRSRVFDLFTTFLATAGATAIRAQTNDPLLTVMLHTFAHGITSERIVFEDRITTHYTIPNATMRRQDTAANNWALDVDGQEVASGGILYHYNRPYGDIHMEVGEAFRQKGYGTYLVQELKRICYEGASVPCARCGTENLVSRKTLQKSGFVPCAHTLDGLL